MVIEALINGEVLTREEIPDELLQDVEGATAQQNFEFRRQLIAMYLEGFRKKLEKFFNPAFHPEYRLIFQSRMNRPDFKTTETDQV